jgi:hypothetical protein
MGGTATITKGIAESWTVDATVLDPGFVFTDANTGQPVTTKVPSILTTALPMTGTTQKGTAGAIAPDQTLFNFTTTARAGVALSATLTTTISTGFTVANLKTLYITDIYVSSNSPNQFFVAITGATDVFVGIAKGDTAPLGLTAIESQAQIPGIVGGQAVSLNLGAAAGPPQAYFDLHGFSQ